MNRPQKRDMMYGDFSIRLDIGPHIQNNEKATEAFHTAAYIWTEFLRDTQVQTPIYISVDLALLQMGVIGMTEAVHLVGPYCGENGILPEPLSQLTNVTFPLCESIQYLMPQNIVFRGDMTFSKAHLKALGFQNLDTEFGRSDGAITFNSRFSFDYDLSDGLDMHKVDFLSVIIHEMGHLLGFISGVDPLDYGEREFKPSVLDLYRFKESRMYNFLSDPRLVDPQVPNHIFLATWLHVAYRFSSGLSHGDKNQAGHWGADEKYGTYIGMMDPTLAAGMSFFFTGADIAAFQAMGYLVNPVPRPIITHAFPLRPPQGIIMQIYIQLLFNEKIECLFGSYRTEAIYDKEQGIVKCATPTDFQPQNVSVALENGFVTNVFNLE